MKYDMFLGKLRMLHHTIRLPITLFSVNSISYSLPDRIETVDTLLGSENYLDALIYSRGQMLTPQYVSNAFLEHFIYFQLTDVYSILIGPFLTETVQDSSISNLIRLKNISIRSKNLLKDHFSHLHNLSDDEYYYCGKLLESLFVLEIIPDQETFPISTDVSVLPQGYFLNTNDNRMQLYNHPPFFLEQEIIRLISAGDMDNAVKILSELNSLSRATLSKDPLRSLKNSLICSCTLFTRAAIAGGVIPDAAFTLSDTFIQTIENVNSMKQLDSMEGKMITSFVKLVKELNETRYSKVIRECIDYVNNNLCDKLSVKLIADHSYMHPNYISAQFKKETGETITNYVQKRRIEESKFFIRYSNSKLSEIANFYQFCSQSHFIQIFKLHTGITPHEYRCL